MSFLIKNAQLIDGSVRNIFIKKDIIYDITGKTPIADTSIDVKGEVVLPGAIDPHVHFRVPGGENKEDWTTGSKAAVAGGITTVLDMPNNNPPITTLERLEQKRKLIAGKSYVNYGLYIGAAESNLEEIKKAHRITGVKVYLGSTTGNLKVDYSVLEEILSEIEVPVVCHSEDGECLKKSKNQELRIKNYDSIAELHDQLRPEECARMSAEHLVEVIKRVKRPVYFCHISSTEELHVLQQARKDGIPLYIETTPHHLFLNKETASHLGNLAKVNPPLRSVLSQEAMHEAVLLGLVDTIGSDHAPHILQEKDVPYHKAPSGMPGIETALPLLLDWYNKGKISLERIVKLMAENPANIFNIKQRGKLESGYYADIVVVDLDLTKEVKNSKLYTKCGWSAFAGTRLTGWPVLTIVSGEVVFKEGEVVGQPLGKEVF